MHDVLKAAAAKLQYQDASTKLLTAAMDNDMYTINKLLENGVEPDSGDLDQRRPLHIAASSDNMIITGFEPSITELL